MKSLSGNWGVKGIAVLLAVLLLAAAMVTDVPTAYADEPAPTSSEEPSAPDAEPTPTPQPTETPQPTQEPLPAETPQPMETPSEAQEIIEINGVECLAGEIIVKLKDDVSGFESQCILNSMDSTIEAELPADNLVVAQVPEGESTEGFIKAMEEQPDVEYAQPNYVYHLPDSAADYDANVTLGSAPNDPYAYEQWNLRMIGAYDAWDITTGSADVRVAVIDTGVDLDHPDLAGKVVAQADVVSNDGSADDGDGHGTHVAGIIAANTNNYVGVAGVAPGIRLIAVDVFTGIGNNAYALTSDVIEGMQFASSNGADVINLSLGLYYRDTAYEQAVNAAVSQGILVVCAAGNDNTTTPHYPSDFDAAVSVIATDWYDGRASYSNYGPGKDISAPGGDDESLPYSGESLILSTYKDGGYRYIGGTSQAAPVVSGVAALILSVNPNLTVNEVKNILYTTAKDKGASGRDNNFGYGRVDAYMAVFAAKAPDTIAAVPTNYNSAYISWSAVPGANGYELSRSTSPGGNYSVVKTTSSLGCTNASMSTGTTYYYRVRAYHMVGRKKVWGAYSSPTTAATVLSPVTSASASAYYPTSIKVSWSAVPGRTRYEVWRCESATGTYTRVGSTTSTYYKDTTCIPFVTYYYQIKVYRTVNRLPIYSASVSPTASATPILGNVSGVKAAVSSPSSVKVSWSSVTGASGYEVLRSATIDGEYVSVKLTTSRSFTDTSCTPNTTYYYQVRAYRKAGGGTVPSTPSTPVSATPYFGSVSNAKAVCSSPGRIKLSWSAVSGRTGYEIYRRSSPDSDFVWLKNTTSTSFTDSGLTMGVTYEYKIVAYRTVNGVKHRSTESVVSTTP